MWDESSGIAGGGDCRGYEVSGKEIQVEGLEVSGRERSLAERAMMSLLSEGGEESVDKRRDISLWASLRGGSHWRKDR